MPTELSQDGEISVDEEKILVAVVRDDAAEKRRGLGHPVPDELLAYVEGALEVEDRERVQEHLALCRRCARVVLDFEEFPEIETTEEEQLSEFEVAAKWRHFQEMTAQDEAPPRSSRPMAAFPRGAYALAASLLVAVLGLSFWVLRLHHEIDGLSQPRVNVHIGDLVPRAEDVERSAADQLRVPHGAEHVLLLLNLADFREFSGYRVEIVDQDERQVWSSEALRRTPDGNFTVEVHRRLLLAGEYRVELYGLEDGARTRLARYEVDVARE